MDEAAIFSAALEKYEPEERQAFLQAACGEDRKLLARIEGLLWAHEHPDTFLVDPVARVISGSVQGERAASHSAAITENSGSQIGPYRLLQQIGEGGMGVVYMAEQKEPVRRRVALKIIKPGMDTSQVVARFQAERQALALMDHPNIARVFDAGATASGRPFFVMELIKGVPIDQYCEGHELPVQERLRLFLSACRAVHHAHQKGIIHRDLKPSNVLVSPFDGEPVVKVIDFGIAKATTAELTEHTAFTGFAQLIGSPLYMSPEQAELNALDVDVRSDVYSLGVLLYELLTGETPFDKQRMRAASFDEIRAMIREEEPLKPSALVSTLQAQGTTVASLPHHERRRLLLALSNELDWIVLRAMAKRRAERYQSVAELADDIERYLSGDRVQACPPSLWYRGRKYTRRHKAALGAAGTVLACAAVLGALVGWIMRDRAARQAVLTAEAAQTLKEAARLEGQERWAEALLITGHAETLLTNGSAPEQHLAMARRRRQELKLLLAIEQARLRQAEVDLDAHRFMTENASAEYARAFAEAEITANRTDPAHVARRLNDCSPVVRNGLIAGFYHWWLSLADEPSSDSDWLKRVLRHIDRDPWRRHVCQALDAGDAAALQRLAKQEDVARQSVAMISILADSLFDAGAVESTRELLQRAQREHPDDFWINFKLGYVCEAVGDLQKAVVYYSAAISIRRNPVAYSVLGSVQRRTGDLSGAVATYQQLLKRKPGYAKAHYNLANALRDMGCVDNAVAAYQESIRLQPVFPKSHFWLGSVLLKQNRLEAAVESWETAVAQQTREDVFPYQRLHEGHLVYVNELGWRLAATAQPASELSRRGRRLAEASFAASAGSLEVLLQHGGEMLLSGDEAGYRAMCRRALETCSPAQAERTPYLVARLCGLGAPREIDPHRVIELAQASVDMASKPEYLHTLATAELRAGRYEQSMRRFQALLNPPHDSWAPRGLNLLGLALANYKRGDAAAAQKLLDGARTWLDENSLAADGPLHPHDRVALRLLLREAAAAITGEGRSLTSRAGPDDR